MPDLLSFTGCADVLGELTLISDSYCMTGDFRLLGVSEQATRKIPKGVLTMSAKNMGFTALRSAKPPGLRVRSEGLFRRLILLQPPLREGIAQNVGAAAQLQLFGGSGLVVLDSLDADAELRGDFFIRKSPGDQAQDLLLALGQFAWRALSLSGGRAPEEVLHECPS